MPLTAPHTHVNRINCIYCMYQFVILRGEYRIFSFCPDTRSNQTLCLFPLCFFFFLILFVLRRKPCLLPDRSVPPVVVHYASGQSYFSSAATPILMNLSQEGTTTEHRQKEQKKDNSKGNRFFIFFLNLTNEQRQRRINGIGEWCSVSSVCLNMLHAPHINMN